MTQDDRIIESQARRGRRRFLLVMVAVIVLGALVGGGIAATGFFDGSATFWGGEAPGWATVVGAVLSLGGVAVAVAGFWWLTRNGYYRRNAGSRLWAESWSRRRNLVRQVRGNTLPRDEDRPLLPQVAEQMIDGLGFLLPLSGLALMQVGQAFFQWAPGFVLLAAIFVGTLTAAGVSAWRSARDAKAFLAAADV
ncbi:hypothetical protein ACIBO1_12990 [Micromonospora sp. NPDC049903]|uniref:hypothetical protein n=1 Tax=Micromonospora sp. NPDC049903 TaxID=3364276 RepID=UPI00379E7059